MLNGKTIGEDEAEEAEYSQLVEALLQIDGDEACQPLEADPMPQSTAPQQTLHRDVRNDHRATSPSTDGKTRRTGQSDRATQERPRSVVSIHADTPSRSLPPRSLPPLPSKSSHTLSPSSSRLKPDPERRAKSMQPPSTTQDSQRVSGSSKTTVKQDGSK